MFTGAGWFLEKVTVKESEFAAAEWVFLAHCWLDDHVGDCKTVRKLKLLGQFEVGSKDKEPFLSSTNEGKHENFFVSLFFMQNIFLFVA